MPVENRLLHGIQRLGGDLRQAQEEEREGEGPVRAAHRERRRRRRARHGGGPEEINLRGPSVGRLNCPNRSAVCDDQRGEWRAHEQGDLTLSHPRSRGRRGAVIAVTGLNWLYVQQNKGRSGRLPAALAPSDPKTQWRARGSEAKAAQALCPLQALEFEAPALSRNRAVGSQDSSHRDEASTTVQRVSAVRCLTSWSVPTSACGPWRSLRSPSCRPQSSSSALRGTSSSATCAGPSSTLCVSYD